MHRFRWVILVALICLPVAFLAFDWHVPGFRETTVVAEPLPVPDGDQEMAWLHTTTANTTWERFVTGWLRARRTIPDLQVDSSNAFLDSTTGVPELVLGMKGRDGQLRIRWYKLQNDIGAADWVRALAERDRPPLAIIGGGSSDRAVDLAKAMEAQRDWRGDRPALFVTTATAGNVSPESDTRLIDLYAGRSFRFCFNNRQMADAVLDFVDQSPDLRPAVTELTSLQAVASAAVAHPKPPRYRPHVFSVQWYDDPYSTDLHEQFSKSLHARADARDGNQTAFQLDRYGIPFSVGGFIRPNPQEEETAKRIAVELRGLPPQRSMLILPAATQPARRLLQAIVERSQRLSRRLVVVTGDGIPVNALLRDGDFAWRAGAMPVPLVLFTHNDPIAWDDGIRWPRGDSNTTEEFMHFAEMARIIGEGCYPPSGGMVDRSDDLIARLHDRRPAFFDSTGDRLQGTGEFVVTLLPRDDAEGARGTAQLSVWRRDATRAWQSTGQLTVGNDAGAIKP